ncbi:MAG TPA: FG-GAP-like repeat-containing protein [Candidatus Didemnitutus sp.]|nr:FG-GAP-like repeat-containing protein [Candidatus Didemnitutus sp.]
MGVEKRQLRTSVPVILAGFVAMLLAAPAQAAGEEIVSHPLAPRSGPRGATLFVEMPPDQTGIVTENAYDDPTMWTEHFAEFETGPVGTGVAIGDFDNDGRPDIFVVSKTESCRLFRNLGNWKFEDVTEKAGVGDHGADAAIWKQGVTFVDVNNDGLLDIYVCRFNAPNLLYINQGDGTFKEEAAKRGLAVNDASVMAAFCDYDRDGFLDVFIQTNRPDSTDQRYHRRNYLFHNNGDGTFKDVTTKAGIVGEAQGHSAVWWDFDGDGWPDLYVANDFTPPDQLWRNNHDGTFTNVIDRVVPHMPFSSMGSDLGDVNNDGLVDLFVADMAATSHQKDQRTMANARSLIVDPTPNSGAPFVMRNALYLNTGTGRCLEAACLAGIAATDWTWAVRLEDLDDDGRIDLFVTNGMHRESHNADLMARMAAATTLEEKVRMEKASPVLAESHLAFRNLGDLQFENVSAAWGLDGKGVSYGAAFGDLDGDGDLDLVYSNYKKGVTVMRNDSDQGHRVNVALHGVRSNRFGIGATIRIETAHGVQVRPLVLARGVLSSSEPMAHFGMGEDSRIDRMVVNWPGGQVQEFTGLDADRFYTVTEPASDRVTTAPTGKGALPLWRDVTDTLPLIPRMEEGATPRSPNPLLPRRLDRNGPALAVSGGWPDAKVAVGGTTRSPRLVRHFSRERTETVAGFAVSDGAALDDGPLLFFDASGQGRADLLVTRAGDAAPDGDNAYQPLLFLEDAHGGYAPAPPGTLPDLPISAGAVTAADFDHSGRLGLFIGGRVRPGKYPQSPRSALLANRGGRFEDVTAQWAPALAGVGMVSGALWTDVDGDGWPDLLLALEWGSVKYFHNTGHGGLEDWTERARFASAGSGWWNSIASADFNGDGKPDFVVGNLGLNTPYQADPVHPALLLDGDFRGDGGRELIEAYFEGDKLYPWRTRRDLGAAIPSILRKFPRSDPYARATLGDIVDPAALAGATRWVATEFRSGVFLSQPDGTYRFEPLPRLAQIAPIYGVVAGDFEGSGNPGIVTVQNSYAPIPSVGRFDGGLGVFLRGDGRGNFAAVPPRESGLVVPGDAKALVTLDLNGDGWPDLLASRNDDSGFAFANGGSPGRHSLEVVLRGRPGNPWGVGARVVLEFQHGANRMAEVAAGSGYNSQSAPMVFFGWTEADPPTRVQVRWPSGNTTEDALASLPAVLEVKEARP